jgi:hypothetical protein
MLGIARMEQGTTRGRSERESLFAPLLLVLVGVYVKGIFGVDASRVVVLMRASHLHI